MSFFDPHFGLPLPEDVQSADSGIFDPIWYQPGAPLSLGNTLGPVAASALEPVATPTLGSNASKKSMIIKICIPPAALAAATIHRKTIKDKETRARIIIARQKSEETVANTMGSDVRIIKTPTGYIIGGVFWSAPAYDATIPTSPAEISVYVDALVMAISNNRGCREQDGRRQFLNRWATESSFYSVYEIEAAARDLVLAMKDIHENGWTKAIYDRDERETYQLTMFYTFEDRFNALQELLMYSKTTCKDVMKGTKFHAIIGNPRVLIKRTAMNVNSNSLKAVRIAKGMEVLKQQQEESAAKKRKSIADEEREEDEERGAGESPPEKRARKSRSS